MTSGQGQILALLLAASVATGLGMVVAFRYTSDQRAVRRAKDRLQANLLAVRLFRDQPPVVLKAYLRTLAGVAGYVRTTARPLLVVLVPLLLALAQLDRSLGWVPVGRQESFLVKARTTAENADAFLQVPQGLALSAPAVHVPQEKEVVWRLVAERDGTYEVTVGAAGRSFSKQVVVSGGIPRVSRVRSRDLWDRVLVSGEARLPADGPLDWIQVVYRPRTLDLFWFEGNWLVPFFVLSLAAGYVFKTVLRIEI